MQKGEIMQETSTRVQDHIRNTSEADSKAQMHPATAIAQTDEVACCWWLLKNKSCEFLILTSAYQLHAMKHIL